MNIFDTHAHFTEDASKTADTLGRARAAGVTRLMAVGGSPALNRAALLAGSASGKDRLPDVRVALGFDRDQVAANESCQARPDGGCPRFDFSAVVENRKVIAAVGEIGLDFHYGRETAKAQCDLFAAQLELARDLSLPIQVHDRDAHGDTLEMLKKYRPSGTLHRFSGSPEMAEEVVKLGMVLGIGGALTYKNSRKEKETVRRLPLDCFILETDCPYLAPSQFRGQVSTSDMIGPVAELIAEIKGETPEKVVQVTSETARRVFGLV